MWDKNKNYLVITAVILIFIFVALILQKIKIKRMVYICLTINLAQKQFVWKIIESVYAVFGCVQRINSSVFCSNMFTPLQIL